MIRIGCVNFDTSHPLAFSGILREGTRARYVALYNDSFREDDEVEAFIANHELEKRCSTVEEMAQMVDVGFVQGTDWDSHLKYAQPFIDAGKYVFIDKPFVGKISDCAKVEALAASGAKILGCSSVRYAYEIRDFLAIPVEERGEVISVFGTAGVNEFDYACHIVEGIGGLMGPGAESARFCGAGEAGGKRTETYFIQYEDGRSATFQTCHGTWQPFEMVITTTKTTYQFRIDTNQIYRALLERLCDAVESGASEIVPVSEITESVKIMLAGRVSRDERDGHPVALTDIPADDPGFDGAAFEKQYGAAARKIYLG
ncbi:MAG TPA: Gfo/Idh/MocA family oxidoreductase [Armatimonadota bacterium]|jgi:hypothetical protein